ncbi:hypothetical protein lerEdw1_009779 [Lerista edwardsae]|nr:hypothetical protein lerEdw1_009779 [Lerista edwardsae]
MFFPNFLQVLMDEGNLSTHLENTSAAGRNTNSSEVVIIPLNVAVCCFISVSFLAGTALNGLFLWVTSMKMKKTVNTLWFFHLILTYLVSSVNMPFVAVDTLLDHQWVFGTLLCKLLNTFGSVGVFTTVFLLTIISMDRYLLICHPVWSQHHRTRSQAQRLVKGVWCVSLVLNAPYLAFRETQQQDGRTKCVNNYALSSNWDGEDVQALRHGVHRALFIFRFLLAFLLPLLIIMGCYYWMGQKMKMRRLSRTGKPYRVLVASVASFFIYWLPYHLYQGAILLEEKPGTISWAFLALFCVCACFNYIFTPILYLFVGEKFQQVFKMSILALLKRGLVDDLPSGCGNEEASQAPSRDFHEAYQSGHHGDTGSRSASAAGVPWI